MRRLATVFRTAGASVLTYLGGGLVSEPVPPQLRSGILDFSRAPPPPVGGGLPLEGLEVGGVGPMGGAGARAYQGGKFFVSAASYPANSPVEDRFDVLDWDGGAKVEMVATPSSHSLLAAVYDGHGGWQAAEYARRTLLECVVRELGREGVKDVREGASNSLDLPERASSALVRAFAATERTFIDAIRPAYAVGFGDVARVGACALAAWANESHVVVANAGDCRAVLGHVCVGTPGRLENFRKEEEGGDSSLNEKFNVVGGDDLGTPTFTVLAEPPWKWRQLYPTLPGGDGFPSSDTTGGGGGEAEITTASSSSSSSFTDNTSSSGIAGELLNPPSPPSSGAAAINFSLSRHPVPSTPLFTATIPMSLDHNAREIREQARLAAEHPGESDVVVCRPHSPNVCYVKSRLQPTRALGDAYLKYREFNEDGGRVRGRYIKPPYSPPYISSIPEIRIQPLAIPSPLPAPQKPTMPGLLSSLLWGFGGKPASGDSKSPRGVSSNPPPTVSFLLLACDGLWDILSNEEASDFIAREIASAAAAASTARSQAAVAAAKASPGLVGASSSEEAAALEAASTFLGGTAERLRHYVLERTAGAEGLPSRVLLNLRPGKGGRRDVHDDITLVICFFGGVESVAKFALEGGGGGRG